MNCLALELGPQAKVGHVLFAGILLLFAAPSSAIDPPTGAIIERCRASIGQHAPEVVKECVDKETAAYRQVQTYPKKRLIGEIVHRCMKGKREYGWHMVNACVVAEAEAVIALKEYGNSAHAITNVCRKSVGKYGWIMVKSCVDREMETVVALNR